MNVLGVWRERVSRAATVGAAMAELLRAEPDCSASTTSSSWCDNATKVLRPPLLLRFLKAAIPLVPTGLPSPFDLYPQFRVCHRARMEFCAHGHPCISIYSPLQYRTITSTTLTGRTEIHTTATPPKPYTPFSITTAERPYLTNDQRHIRGYVRHPAARAMLLAQTMLARNHLPVNGRLDCPGY